MEQRILFNSETDINKEYFRDVPGIGAADYLGKPVTKKASELEIYCTNFSEKYFEKDNVLEISEFSDSTKLPVAQYLAVNGYSQSLYLMKYSFTYTTTNKKNGKPSDHVTNGVVFFAVKRNGSNYTLGVMPAYFGIVNEEDNLIAFDTPLELKKDKNKYYLKRQRRNKKLNGLIFIPADFPVNPVQIGQTFKIDKIVNFDPNKVGGFKPLVFNIAKIFHDPYALEFHFLNILHLNK
jgi:hypothetical protein